MSDMNEHARTLTGMHATVKRLRGIGLQQAADALELACFEYGAQYRGRVAWCDGLRALQRAGAMPAGTKATAIANVNGLAKGSVAA
jgi:hypothetical protein